MSEMSYENYVQDEFINETDGNQISEVVVYTDQAYVKRQARIQTQPGLNRFLMEIKAYQVDVESAQANVYGEGEILSVQHREIPVKDMPQEDVRKLDKKRDELTRERKALKNEKEVQDKQLRFLDSVTFFAETELPKELKTQFPETESLKTVVEFLGENYQKLSRRSLELDRKIEELDKEIAVTEKRLKRLRRPKHATQKAIEVLFESPKTQEIDVQVFYVAAGATWEPVYRVDVPLDLSRVRMTMFARIQQKTGEDWKNVKIAISNAVPLRGAALPDMKSWYLRLPPEDLFMAGAAAVDAEVPSAMQAATEGAQEAEAELLAEPAAELYDLEEPLSEAEFRQAEQRELPLAFEYQLPQPINMGSGDGDTILPLYNKKMDGDFFVYAVPKSDPLAYLVCRCSPDSELLSGRLNVHFGGRFVGGTALSEKKAGEDLLINLGAERGVKVQREKVTDKLTETFFGKVDRSTAARELEYRIIIENIKDETTRVQVLDAVPVSKIDRIQVKGVEAKPQPTTKDYQEREGVMLWDLQLKPRAVQDIRMKFFVKHPKDNPPQAL